MVDTQKEMGGNKTFSYCHLLPPNATPYSCLFFCKLLRIKKLLDLLRQNWYILLYNIPKLFGLNCIVSMHQNMLFSSL